MPYWHYTCKHSSESIDETLVLRPNRQPILANLPLIWFTTQIGPPPRALGLTSLILGCDRMEHLYRVVNEDAHLIMRWGDLKTNPSFTGYLAGARRLEAARGARPGLWAVAFEDVRVERSLHPGRSRGKP